MLFNVATFVNRVETDLNALIDDLSALTGRNSDNERFAWQQSLPKLSVALSDDRLKHLHVQVGHGASLALEYRLPASSSWCDAVLLGSGKQKPVAAILELKDWDTSGIESGPRAGLIFQHDELRLHPSEQVRGYAEYCRAFHSTVQSLHADVLGCVFLTKKGKLDGFITEPHKGLIQEYPLFNATDVLADYLSGQLIKPDEEFAQAFVRGAYKQERNFIIQVAKSINEPQAGKPQFVLLDNQRFGYERCLQAVDGILTQMTNAKRSSKGDVAKAAIIIQGPPGSGKSVLAAKLWAAVAQDNRLADESVVFTTTSGSQRSNWERTFRLVANNLAGRGIVWPANRYNPGLSPAWVAKARGAGYDVEVETWKENLKLFKKLGNEFDPADNSVTVAIVDEAHSLINPAGPGTRGIPPAGWALHAGPQAYHILRVAQCAIFLMDGDQSYRDNESTRVDDIKSFAESLNIPVTEISLNDAQFRCAGSKEYIDWLGHVLGTGSEAVSTESPKWKASHSNGSRGTGFLFELVEDPFELEDALRARLAEGYSARLVASYAREWITKGVVRPHKLPDADKDFNFKIKRDGRAKSWSRIWNYAPGMDYTLFIQAPEGSNMHEDPLCEVGCPYVVRGFDYDYLGVLWLKDLVWRSGRWHVDVKEVFDTALPLSLRQARDGKSGLLDIRIKRAYRILLSRAIRGLYVWCEDPETQDQLSKLLSKI
jgi:hypothetical protein